MKYRPLTLLWVGLLATGCEECSDWELFPNTDPELRPDPEDDPNYNKGDVENYPPLNGEYCNGLDDDGDGLIDEDYPDIDGDGIADCVDDDCSVEVGQTSTIGISPTCAPERSFDDTDPWDVVVEWRWEALESNANIRNILMAPIVGNLTDDNGDGLINGDDIPEIVFVAFDDPDDVTGRLIALDGETGEEVMVVPGLLPFGGIVIADINSNGVTEIVGFNSGGVPWAIDANGETVWIGDQATTSVYPQATVADLDGNGTVEVLADNLVVDGVTGTTLFAAPIDPLIIGRMPTVGDIDLDGKQEFMMGQTVYELNGTEGVVQWSTDLFGTYGHWAAILDANGDPYGEVAVISEGYLHIYDHLGNILVQVKAGTDQPGPPCVADFDGDGISELAWGSSTSFNVYELDGSRLWTFPMSDQSGLAGCSGYDFDADGSYEVLMADEQAFYILDGKTGQLLYGNMGHASGTVFEYPIIADVDRDGSAEVVVVSSDYRFAGEWSGITVFGQAEDAWARSGPTWHVHDFAVTNINEDGAVPAHPIPPWQVHNVYRARPSTNESFVDLQVAIIDVCVTGCVGDTAVAKISIQAYNTGSSASLVQIPIALYANYDGQYELLDVKHLPNRVAPGKSSDGVLFEVPIHRLGTHGVMARINDPGNGTRPQIECDYDNNEDLYLDIPCQGQ
jgi:hypothetical protein